ncbi:MAG: hypothetical protein KAR81_07790 [Sulfurimonas sp.]|nr:hypothetical protein [Sulfurimonas sp.]
MEIFFGVIILVIVILIVIVRANSNSKSHADEDLEPIICPKCGSEDTEMLTGSAKENWRCYICNHTWV